MLTEQTHSEPNWKLLPGNILDGGYEMEEILQADDKRARFKVRVLGDRTIDAIASFFPLSGTAAEEQVEVWNSLRLLPHPNLSKPLAAGQKVLDGIDLVYLVARRADETLGAALTERALTAEEASEVMLSCSRALEYLGRQGLVPDSISPKEILAVDDSIQLSAERIKTSGSTVTFVNASDYLAPESSKGNSTGPAAVWCLGATIFETLTQQAYDESRLEEARRLPLGWILDRCLSESPEARCKPEELPALLKSGPPAKPVIHEPPVATVPIPVETSSAANLLQPTILSVSEKESLPTSLAAAAGSSLPAAASAPTYSAQMESGESATPQTPVSKPVITSVSQARTKILKQSEFDVLTAPQSGDRGPVAKASSAAAAAAGSLAASQMSGAGNGTALRRVPDAGPKLQSGSVPPVAPRSRPLSNSPLGSMPADFTRGARRVDLDTTSEANRTRLWIYLAAGLAVLLVMFLLLRSKSPRTAPVSAPAASSTTAQNNPASSTPAAADSSNANKAWPTRTLQPDQSVATPQLKPVPSAAPAPTSAAPGAAVWRVVVFTYNRQEDAAKKAHSLNAKHPHLQAQVFSPNGRSGPYLVTVGGRMTREEAARFRARSLGSGLPRDSYIQNYKP